MKNLKLEDLPYAMELVLEKLDAMKNELNSIKEKFQPVKPVELLTREETADFLKISLTTLWHWSKKGILPSYGMGNRVYYKRSEIENALVQFRVQ